MALMDKKRQRYEGPRSRRRRHENRRRLILLAALALVVLVLGAGYLLAGSSGEEEVGTVGLVEDPTVDGAPEAPAEDEASEDEAAEEDEASEGAEEDEAVLVDELVDDEVDPNEEDEVAPVAPLDTTMFLSVPKLGISGATVTGGELGLEVGAQHVSGVPWEKGSNTYIAGHRIGFPGSGSDHIFYNLPGLGAGDLITLSDTNGTVYNYAVSEVFAVSPTDLWVLDPTGADMISLQVCTETPDDWWTIGPRLFEGGPDSGRLVVRGVKV